MHIFRRFALIFYTVICTIFVTAGVMGTAPAQAQASVQAEDDGPPLRVATHPIEPFVMEEEGELEGFSVDLWDALAQKVGVEYEWLTVDSVHEQLAAVKNGEADVAIAAITINREREALIDFSYPYFDSGLQILTAYEPDGPLRSLVSLISAFFSPVVLQLIVLLFLVMLIVAHAVWIVERHRNPDFSTSYLHGIWDGFWWAAVTVSTVGYGDKTAKGTTGRIVSLVWIFLGLFLMTQLTASVTATLAVKHINSQVNELADLPHKRIATVEGTTSAKHLRSLHMRPITVPDIDGAIQLLENGQVDAVVYDAPVLQYYAANDGEGKVTTVGSPFQTESYGIALPTGSPYRDEVNLALLDMMESGEYDTLYASWFGETPR